MTLIDKEALLEKLSTFHPDYTFNITSFRNFVNAQPAVDAVPVIRCKDCKYRCETEDGEYNPEDIVCTYWMSDGLNENDYCSAGGRKENG